LFFSPDSIELLVFQSNSAEARTLLPDAQLNVQFGLLSSAHILDAERFAICGVDHVVHIFRCARNAPPVLERREDLRRLGTNPYLLPISSSHAIVRFETDGSVVPLPPMLLDLNNGAANPLEDLQDWEEQLHRARGRQVGWRWFITWGRDDLIEDERHFVVRYDFDRRLNLQERAALAFSRAIHSSLAEDALRSVFAVGSQILNPPNAFVHSLDRSTLLG
jgi:hypothetical protein